MKRPLFRGSFAMPGELVVDNFAGGGGASTGIEAALNRPVDIAINHDPEAIACHAANHPETRHYCENIWEVDPREACAGRPVGLAWFSPDCTHFSRAKGSTPVKKEIRGLAWVVIRWAETVRPRVIVLENVEEFQTWGPLTEDNRPDPSHAGETFREWLATLTGLGYRIEFRSMVAADFGAPTTRKRFYLVARRDGASIAWPEQTHGFGRAEPWRPAADIIDWSLPCPSIFDRARPLAVATLRRIAEGIRRYVLETRDPYVVGSIAPSLVQTGYGERPGQRPRYLDIHKPLGTLVNGQKHGLVAAFLAKHYGGVIGHGVQRPIGTVTSQDHHSLVTTELSPTGGERAAEVRAFLLKYYGTGTGQQLSIPAHTVTSRDRFALVQVAGETYEIADIGMRMLQPRELFNAQGFPADYEIAPELDGAPLSKTAQIRLAGNSVCPPVARAIVATNATRCAVQEAA